MALTSVAAGTSTWAWPAADWPPTAGDYVQRHPTHYTWRPEVEEWARYLVDHYGVWCNSYYDHPATEFVASPSSGGRHIVGEDSAGTWRREHCSLDVWAYAGRGYPVDMSVGDKIFNLLMNYKGKPDIEWIIWRRHIYGAWNNWQGEFFGDGSVFTNHDDHIHVGWHPWWDWKPWNPPPPSELVPVDGKAFTAKMFADAVPGLALEDAYVYHPHLVAMMRRYRINNRPRISAFLAQTGHESGSFEYWEEIGGENMWYAPYYGRSPMQITLEGNYAAFGKYGGHNVLYSTGGDPNLLANDTQVGFDATGWFWGVYEDNDLSVIADEATWEAFYKITRIINGGTNGWDDRNNRYTQAWNALPADVTLEEKPLPEEPKPDPVPEPEKPIVIDPNNTWIGFSKPDNGVKWLGAIDHPKGSWIGYKKREDGDGYDLRFYPGNISATEDSLDQAGWREAQVKQKKVRFRVLEAGEVFELDHGRVVAEAGQVLVEEGEDRFIMAAEDFGEDYEVKPDDGGGSKESD